MRIVDRDEFLSLPAGIMYQKYKPCVAGDIHIKDHSLTNDWRYTNITDNVHHEPPQDIFDVLLEAQEKGTSFKMDYFVLDRDGLFEEDQLFIVYEREDIERLAYHMIATLNAYPTFKFRPKKKEDK